MTNGHSHPYQMGEPTFNFRGIRSDFSFHFSMKFISANRIALLRRHIWGYSVCLCPIKRTQSLYGLIQELFNYLPSYCVPKMTGLNQELMATCLNTLTSSKQPFISLLDKHLTLTYLQVLISQRKLSHS